MITLGPGGGAAVEPGGNITRVPGFPTKVVDTVGAGDTFMAASIVCSRRGPQPPTSAEVDDLIAEKA